MLTLDEAITRFNALSKANRSRAESYNRGEDYELMKAKECETCADECEQVASWLEELDERREADRWIPVSERLPNDRDWYLGVFKEPDTDFIGIPYICDYVGEITKGTTNEGWILRNCTDVDNVPDYFRNLICVAWRPLPEPYKESEAEE